MTQSLSNEAYAERMRVQRGEPPKHTITDPTTFQYMSVWMPHHKEALGLVKGLAPKQALMTPCSVGGLVNQGVRAHVVHMDDTTISKMLTTGDGPDIWRVTFHSGSEPDWRAL